MEVEKLVNVWNYCDTSDKSKAVTIKNLTLYFSYETIIAFSDDTETAIVKNGWSMTTGKHLNSIDRDKNKRIDYKEFKEKLTRAFIRNGILNAQEEIAKVL